MPTTAASELQLCALKFSDNIWVYQDWAVDRMLSLRFSLIIGLMCFSVQSDEMSVSIIASIVGSYF